MSPEDRKHLARLLATIDEPHVLRDNRARWRRGLSLLLFMGSCVVLAAWIAVLMLTLPRHYTADHWRGAWVGFDFALLGAFAGTAWAAWRERQVLIILLTVTGTLLCCDAWFDVILDLGTRNIWMSGGAPAGPDQRRRRHATGRHHGRRPRAVADPAVR